MKFVASVEFRDDVNSEVRSEEERFDVFRESVLPGTEYGVTISNLRSDGADWMVDIEIDDADSIVAAQDRFDAFREATHPGLFGITMWNLRRPLSEPSFRM